MAVELPNIFDPDEKVTLDDIVLTTRVCAVICPVDNIEDPVILPAAQMLPVVHILAPQITVEPYNVVPDIVPPTKDGPHIVVVAHKLAEHTLVVPNTVGEHTAVVPKTVGLHTAVEPNIVGPQTAVVPKTVGAQAAVTP